MKKLLIDDPHDLLRWLSDARELGCASFDEVEVAHVFAVAAVAALARDGGKEKILFSTDGPITGGSRFARAIGIKEAATGTHEGVPTEADRTVKLTRFLGRGPKEEIAKKIVGLLQPMTIDAGEMFRYVLVELLRNVVQHSNDPLGGVVSAQVNTGGPYARAPAVQIVVVDNGIGVFEALRHMRPSILTPATALTAALEPHVSGTFQEGESGSSENAGLGLFFISEMAKQTSGKLLLASRGATYFLDRSRDPKSQPVITEGDKPEYPGTMVVFETAIAHVRSFDEIIRRIRHLAEERVPKRVVHRWLRFEAPPQGASEILISVAAEDTAAAQQFAMKTLQPRLLSRMPVVLNFQNVRGCTQSFLHALLHECVRLAWALRVPVYIVGAAPAVRSQLELVEAYSLGG